MSQFCKGLDNMVESLCWPPKVGDIVILDNVFFTTNGERMEKGELAIISIMNNQIFRLKSINYPGAEGSSFNNEFNLFLYVGSNYIGHPYPVDIR